MGVLALLGSTASMAAAVDIRPNDTCVDLGGGAPSCDLVVNPGDSFSLTVHASAFPGNGAATGVTGGSFTFTYDSTVVAILGVRVAEYADCEHAGEPVRLHHPADHHRRQYHSPQRFA